MKKEVTRKKKSKPLSIEDRVAKLERKQAEIIAAINAPINIRLRLRPAK